MTPPALNMYFQEARLFGFFLIKFEVQLRLNICLVLFSNFAINPSYLWHMPLLVKTCI